MTTMLKIAQSYQVLGFPVYPLAPNTSKPLISRHNGGHGYLDATLDPQQTAAWWHSCPNANIGISLANTGIVMLDLDRHDNTGADGFAALKYLASEGRAGELSPTYMETTPRNGLHLFYRLPQGMQLDGKSGTALFGSGPQDRTGIDFTTTGVPIAPDRRPEGKYKRTGSRTIDGITEAPNWLVAELQRVTQHNIPDSSAPRRKSWAGRLLDEMVAGTVPGSRNDYLTRIAGKLLATGADPETAYNLLLITNTTFITDPLPDREVNGIFKSVLKREERRNRNASNTTTA